LNKKLSIYLSTFNSFVVSSIEEKQHRFYVCYTLTNKCCVGRY
jgi:hypothetical protein